MRLWFHTKRLNGKDTCTECGRKTRRANRLCAACEREREQRSIDAQRGFSVELAGYVPVPRVAIPADSVGDAAGSTLQD